MSALTAEDRQKGFKVMQKRMEDPATKVRQRLKAGRPRRIVNQILPPMAAVGRIVDAIETGRRLMREHGLNPDDITAGLVHTTIESGEFGCKWLPDESGQIGEYVTDFERMAAGRTLLFLGMLWKQRHTDGVSLWVTPFMGGEPARLQLEAVMNFAAQAKN